MLWFVRVRVACELRVRVRVRVCVVMCVWMCECTGGCWCGSAHLHVTQHLVQHRHARHERQGAILWLVFTRSWSVAQVRSCYYARSYARARYRILFNHAPSIPVEYYLQLHVL